MEHPVEVAIAVKRTVHEALTTALASLSSPLSISGSIDRVVVKPSILDPKLPGNTSLDIMHSVVGLFKESSEILIVESDNPLRTTSDAFSQCGYHELAGNQVKLVNLTTEPQKLVVMPGHHFETHSIPISLLGNRLLVNVATLKVDPESHAVSGAVKNLFGLLPDVDKQALHPFLDDVLLDMLDLSRPDLTIMDLSEVVVGERLTGEARRVGGVVVGRDAVAVDAFCAGLLGFDSLEVPYIRRAHEIGLGEAILDRIAVRGTEHQKRVLAESMRLR
ncbi:MAG: DUF362 domain-containing protein [Candidatus Thorarchaeota archaeon]